jgi:hypothetical protein
MKMRLARAGALSAVALAALASTALAAALAAPTNVTRPSITGTAREGQTLTARNGTWQNSPTSFRYRWQRCGADGTGCVNLVGETQRTYTLDANDVGKTVRVFVTAANADGSNTEPSDPSSVISSSTGPRSTAKPTISGSARPGDELVADPGTWSGAPDRFGYQWQRCGADGNGCTDVAGATGKTYGVRSADLQSRLRVVVQAANSAGSGTATSDPSAVVATAAPPPTARNQRPRVSLLSTRKLGNRVYARFRVCDDSRKNVSILQTDSRPGVASYTRRFATLTAPLPCGVYTRSWRPAARFRGGRYTVTVRVRDKSGLMSAPSRRVLFL